ncbi:MAG TPA: hypothetical protein VF230_11015 [Acidimicrobiales bacterium]
MVRTRRIEVVDAEGRVRVVVGNVGVTDDIFGLVVRNGYGRDRVWMLAQERVAEVGLDHGGNTVAALSVSDEGDPALYLA